jgi:hypothetical protein
MKCCIRNYYHLLTQSSYKQNQTTITGTLRKDLHKFLWSKVTGWWILTLRIPTKGNLLREIPNHPRTTWRTHCDDVIVRDTHPHARIGDWFHKTLASLVPFVKVTGQILRNAPDLLRYACSCLHFLHYFTRCRIFKKIAYTGSSPSSVIILLLKDFAYIKLCVSRNCYCNIHTCVCINACLCIFVLYRKN